MSTWKIASACWLAALTACAGAQDDAPAPAAASGAPDTPAAIATDDPPFDVGAVIDQVHFAFQADGDAWRMHHTTYGVRVEDGRVAVRARAGDQTGAELVVATTAAERGGAPLALAAPTARQTDDGGLALARGAVEERLVNRAAGVEQRWHFAAAPAGEGDLVVRVAASGLPFAGATDGGLHFLDGATGVGVRYGHATWIDARGARAALDARWDAAAGEILLTVPAEILDTSAYPAVLDPVLSPETGMDNPVTVNAYREQSLAAVAHDGTNWLVVWQDQRVDGTLYDIFAARVDGTGAVLDPAGIVVASGPANQKTPAVLWTGANYFVAWEHAAGVGSDIHATRVSAAGVVLDAPGTGTPVSTAAGTQARVAMATTSGVVLLVWEDDRSGTMEIYGARMNPLGQVNDAAGLVICDEPGIARAPAVATNGSNFFVVWDDTRNGNADIYGARVSTSGNVSDAAGIAVATGAAIQDTPAIAFGTGTGNYLVVYESDNDLAANLVNASTGAPSPAIAVSAAAAGQFSPSLAFDGTSYLVVWEDSRNGQSDVYGARVSAAGSLLDATGVTVGDVPGSNAGGPALAFGGGQYLVAFDTGTNGNIRATRVATGSATPLDAPPLTISLSGNRQTEAAVAFDGTNFLVVWADKRTYPEERITATRVSQAGVVLNPSGISLTTSGGSDPAVAFGGGTYLVAFRTSGANPNIHGARVTPAGSASGVFVINNAANEQGRPAVASDGTNFFVVWEDFRNGATYDIYGTRVTTTGTVLDDPAVGVLVSGAAFNQRNPDVAYHAPSFMVVWDDLRTPANGTDIYGARVNGFATLQDANGFVISNAANNQTAPEIAVGGGTALVVFEDARNVTAPDVYGQRVAAAGTLSGVNFNIATAGQNVTPTVAYDGSQFAVFFGDDGDIVLQRVATDGALAGGALNIATSAAVEQLPAAASTGAGRTLVAYERFDTTTTLMTMRVRATVVTNNPLGAMCGNPNECASGFCVDGVCCDTVCGGGSTSDCQACSTAAGAAVNGSCAPRSAGSVCRAAAGGCDVAETCNGAVVVCPIDTFAAPGTSCRASAGMCDLAESCTGADPACPADAFVAPGTVCRAAAGVCDVAEACTGAAAACPADANKPDGSACADGLVCDGMETCQAGACVEMPLVCNDNNACTTDSCGEPGGCSNAPVAGCCNVDADCGDGNACTADVCSGPGGTCMHNPIAGCCNAPGDCADGSACTTDACNLANHTCEHTPVPNCCGSAAECDDGRACTTDSCTVATGTCENAPIAGCCEGNGDCDDGDTCTMNVCGAGGTCSFQAIPGCCNGDSDCDDGDACTDDTCNGTTQTCEHVAMCPDAGPGDPDAGAGQPDAGTGPGQPDAGGGAGGGGDSGCGCRAGGQGSAPAAGGSLLLVGLAALVIGRRGRRGRLGRDR